MSYRISESPDERTQEDFKSVVAAVEADSYAKHMLWQEYSPEARKYRVEDRSHLVQSWRSPGMGYMLGVGWLGEKQVTIEFFIYKINERAVMFYSSPSVVVDHDQVRAWLEKWLPKDTIYTDATHISQAFHHINRLNENAKLSVLS